ncbi:MAG TPA: antitoxin family protein [Gemmataceae bacterium]|nr:antitoxin family protein [Gemmataceae bacterium]
MTTTVRAIYANGVLRPDRPLPLAEGQAVEVTISPTAPSAPVDEEAVLRRMEAAKSLKELFALYESLPPPDDGYDLCEALNANRRETGEPLVYPELEGGTRP